MRAISKTGPAPGFTETRDHPDVDLRTGDVRIAVEAASVCGSDRAFVEFNEAAKGFDLSFPVVLGHEVAGSVVEVGAEVTSLKVGDRVALESHLACKECGYCRTGQGHTCDSMRLLGVHVDGGFAERTVVPASTCFRLPESVGAGEGALFESAGVAVHAYLRSRHRLTAESVLVAGAGPIGLVLVQLAMAMGAKQVTVVEPNPFRAEVAAKLGASVVQPSPDVADECRSLTAGRGGYDVAFDCSGANGALGTALAVLRREGTAVSVGLPRAPVELDTADLLIRRGLTLTGSYGRSLWTTWELLATLVSTGRLDLTGLITHRLPLEDFGRAIDLLDGDSTKVLLLPQLH